MANTKKAHSIARETVYLRVPGTNYYTGTCSECGENADVRKHKTLKNGQITYRCRETISGDATPYNGYIKKTFCQNPDCALTHANVPFFEGFMIVHHTHGDNTNSQKHSELLTLCKYCHDMVERDIDSHIKGRLARGIWAEYEKNGLVTKDFLESSLKAKHRLG